MSNKITELEKRKLEVQTEWNGKANVCIHCGRVPETFYIVTGHDHTDDSFRWCVCREVSDSIESIRTQLKEAKRDNELLMLNLTQCGQQLAASQAREQQLREALQFLNSRIVTMDLGGVAERALSLPSDTTSLEAMIQKAGEVMKGRAIRTCRDFGLVGNAIRALPAITLEDIIK